MIKIKLWRNFFNASQELNTTNNRRATDILPNPCTNNPLVLLTFDAS